MTAIAMDAHTLRLRLPARWLSRVHASLVLQRAELRLELHLERRTRATATVSRVTAAHRASAAAATRRADELRTSALAQRLPGF